MNKPKLTITLDREGIAKMETEGFPSGFTAHIVVNDLQGETESVLRVPDDGKQYFTRDPGISWDDIFKHCVPMADHILWTLLPAHIKLRVLGSAATAIREMVYNESQILRSIKNCWTERISTKLWGGLQDTEVTYAGQDYSIMGVTHKIQNDKRGFKISLPQFELLPGNRDAFEQQTIADPSDPKFKFKDANIDTNNQKNEADASKMTFAEYQQLQVTEAVQIKEKSDQTDPGKTAKPESKLTVAERMERARLKVRVTEKMKQKEAKPRNRKEG